MICGQGNRSLSRSRLLLTSKGVGGSTAHSPVDFLQDISTLLAPKRDGSLPLFRALAQKKHQRSSRDPRILWTTRYPAFHCWTKILILKPNVYSAGSRGLRHCSQSLEGQTGVQKGRFLHDQCSNGALGFNSQTCPRHSWCGIAEEHGLETRPRHRPPADSRWKTATS